MSFYEIPVFSNEPLELHYFRLQQTLQSSNEHCQSNTTLGFNRLYGLQLYSIFHGCVCLGWERKQWTIENSCRFIILFVFHFSCLNFTENKHCNLFQPQSTSCTVRKELLTYYLFFYRIMLYFKNIQGFREQQARVQTNFRFL